VQHRATKTAPEIDVTFIVNPPETIDWDDDAFSRAVRPTTGDATWATLGRPAKTAQAVASGGARTGGRCAVSCAGGNATGMRGDTSQINGGGMTLTANAGRTHRDKCWSTRHSGQS